MRFQDAVQQTNGLSDSYEPGLQALKPADRARIHCNNTRNLAGSVNLDEALADSLPNDPRWDYGIGMKTGQPDDRAIWVEVHPASSNHIQDVLNKLSWLRAWLRTSAPLLDTISTEFVWVASGRVAIPPNSPQKRKLAAAGIRFAGERLSL